MPGPMGGGPMRKGSKKEQEKIRENTFFIKYSDKKTNILVKMTS